MKGVSYRCADVIEIVFLHGSNKLESPQTSCEDPLRGCWGENTSMIPTIANSEPSLSTIGQDWLRITGGKSALDIRHQKHIPKRDKPSGYAYGHSPAIDPRRLVVDVWTGSDYGFSGSVAFSVLLARSPEGGPIYVLDEFPHDLTQARKIDVKRFAREHYCTLMMRHWRWYG